MDRDSPFSYACNACGRCCHDKVITLSPYDLLRIARAAGLSTADAIGRLTIRRGSVLKFVDGGACVALDGARCSIHSGRPLACRLYPLGVERGSDDAGERFVQLEPAAGSPGVYGDAGTVQSFLDAQGVDEYLAVNQRYRELLPVMRTRIDELVDFERIEPREFWRRAVRDALAETNFEPNPLIDALFDVDLAGDGDDPIAAHLDSLARAARASRDAAALASAAILLAVSLGFSPAAAIDSNQLPR